MKGFCAIVLASLPAFASAPLASPVHVAFTHDEETGCAGAKRLLRLLSQHGVRPEWCIVGEPTAMEATVGHKGCLRTTVRIRGVSAHSSLAPRGVNAVEYASRAVTFLSDLAERLQQEGPFNDSYSIRHTTLAVGVIAGGTEPNIIPNACEFTFEMRAVPGHDVEQLRAEIEGELDRLRHLMRREHRRAGIQTKVIVDVPPLLPTTPNQAELAYERFADRRITKRCVSYGTEAGLFQAAGIDTIVCGPGSIDQAHVADEYVELAQLVELEDLLDRLRAALHEPETHDVAIIQEPRG